MKWIGNLVVAGLLLRAVYTDKKEGKIENWLLLTGFVLGLLFSYLNGGEKGLLNSLGTAAIILVPLFLLFLIKGLGAGDIKLFCVLAVFFPKEAVSIVVISFFAGGVLAVGNMILRWAKKEKVFIKHETMNFSVPIAVGTCIVIMMEYLK